MDELYSTHPTNPTASFGQSPIQWETTESPPIWASQKMVSEMHLQIKKHRMKKDNIRQRKPPLFKRKIEKKNRTEEILLRLFRFLFTKPNVLCPFIDLDQWQRKNEIWSRNRRSKKETPKTMRNCWTSNKRQNIFFRRKNQKSRKRITYICFMAYNTVYCTVYTRCKYVTT